MHSILNELFESRVTPVLLSIPGNEVTGFEVVTITDTRASGGLRTVRQPKIEATVFHRILDNTDYCSIGDGGALYEGGISSLLIRPDSEITTDKGLVTISTGGNTIRFMIDTSDRLTAELFNAEILAIRNGKEEKKESEPALETPLV
jgi:hypothetical protein